MTETNTKFKMYAHGWVYYFLRFVFRVGIFIFYHSMEVHNREALLNLKCPTIVLMNHTNSLVDAAVAVTACAPKSIRLTAKDTLWEHPFWKYFMRGTGTVPIQRGDDHSKTDNRNALSFLYAALQSNSAVAMFPEGRSRFLPHLLPLRTGASVIALNYLIERRKRIAEGSANPDPQLDRIALLPCGITYLHREKYRSDALVHFGDPVIMTIEDIVRSCGSSLEPPRASVYSFGKQITGDVEKQLSLLTFSAPSWEAMLCAHVARKLARPPPPERYYTLPEHVKITSHFARIFSDTESMSPDEKEIMEEFKVYSGQLFKLGIKDERIRLMGNSGPVDRSLLAILKIILRLLLLAPILAIALPGMLALSPIFFLVRVEEWRILKKPGGHEMHRDELAQYKMAYALLVPVFLVVSGAVSIGLYYSSFLYFIYVFIGMPVYLWTTVRCMEDIFASLRSILALTRLIKHGKELDEMRTLRQSLVPKACEIADKHNVPLPKGRILHILDYFNPLRRRKKDWNEVLRLYDSMPGL